MPWRIDQNYAFCASLDRGGWAWQFLRREPAYRADYAEFIATWRQLESAYGTPPNRDFFKWKQDPRAWRPDVDIAGCGADVCPGDNDQVLIECWMGAKWGLRKFPPDPSIPFPDDLAWREQPIQVDVITGQDLAGYRHSEAKLALIFDLAASLSAQLEAAKLQLVVARQRLALSGQLPPRNVREGAATWRRWLRLLDALESGASLAEIGDALEIADTEQQAAAAIALRGGGYRRLLTLDP
jgi:hypothetical protein